jgi:hypothetical protein
MLGAIAACLCAPSLDAQEHGDHNPHHGGVVLMYGLDLHYEVVFTPSGKVELWLSNAAREDLPASVVSDVAVEIESAGKRRNVDMAINPNGDGWVGQWVDQKVDQGAPPKAERTTLHLGFVFRGEPAIVSFPATSLMGEGRERLVKDTAHAPSQPAASAPAKKAPATAQDNPSTPHEGHSMSHEGHSMGHEGHAMPAHEGHGSRNDGQ